MSDYLLSLDEIKQVDDYLDRGYTIRNVYENLSGMFVEFEWQDDNSCLQLLTAEARKYFAAKLKEQTRL